MTSEQLEAARAERMRQNGNGTLTLEDARTWMEETGLCLFLPKRQFSSALAPSFVEAVAGQRTTTPDPRQIAVGEELLVRLETDGVAVRLNLLGQPGEQPDYVVAAWVLPYVYALRGDRDWRRIPQLTGSRQVSPLAVQAYKRLEAGGDATIAELKQALGQGVSETAVLRAITELWQQLRIIPIVSAPGKPAKWQLLRQRFQKAIAEGASTSQVTAISVLASIFLQAVIAASMEEVEIFLSPLTARSKIREVLRGLVATRQVHTLSLGHAPHFYVAGTLPEFTVAPTIYASTVGSAYLARLHDQEEFLPEPAPAQTTSRGPEPVAMNGAAHNGVASHNGAGPHRTSPQGSGVSGRTHFNRGAAHSRERKPGGGAMRHGSESRSARSTAGRSGSSRSASGRPAPGRVASGTRWQNGASKTAGASRNGSGHSGTGHNGAGAKPARAGERTGSGGRSTKNGSPSWSKRAGASKAGTGSRTAGLNHGSATARKETRPSAKSAHGKRKPALAAGSSGPGKRFDFAKQGTKKQG